MGGLDSRRGLFYQVFTFARGDKFDDDGRKLAPALVISRDCEALTHSVKGALHLLRGIEVEMDIPERHGRLYRF
jgi:hypothetical protein